VVIMGESGRGKELAARAIHAEGPWRDRPFVPVDCGALTPTLIESQLIEGGLIKDERWNRVRQGTAEGSIRTAAGTSFTASRTKTVGPGSNLPAHTGAPGGVRRAPRRGIPPSDAPQEVLGLLARHRPGGITDLTGDAHGRTGGVHPLGRQPAAVEIRRHHSVIHSFAELSYSQARAQQPIDRRGV
jgi:hypothetical protein